LHSRRIEVIRPSLACINRLMPRDDGKQRDPYEAYSYTRPSSGDGKPLSPPPAWGSNNLGAGHVDARGSDAVPGSPRGGGVVAVVEVVDSILPLRLSQHSMVREACILLSAPC